MKNKPLRHKETNTFKFQPFSERISNIDVDVFHRVGHLNEFEEEDNVTYFYKTLQKCNDLNLAKSYESLKKKIGGDIRTLPQLLLQKERIVSVLSETLDKAESFSLQPCLELVVALAQDLRQEFYPFYSNLLTKILNLLNTKDTDQLEWAFTCLAYLFKYLWRFLLRDLNIVFEQLLPLLSSSRPQYINNFAAESFAFVARKVKDKRNFLKLVLKSVIKINDGVSGCGRLLFEVVRGVQGQFHTCAQSWLQFLLDSVVDDGLPSELLVEILSQMFACIAAGIYTKCSKIFWDILQETLRKQASKWSDENTEKYSVNITNLLKLTIVLLNHKNGVFLLNPAEFVKTVIEIFLNRNWPSQVIMVLVDISRTILLSPRVSLPQDLTVALIQKIISTGDWNAIKMFTNEMKSYSGFDILVLPSFLLLCQEQNFNEVLIELTKIVLNKTPPAKSFEELKHATHDPLPCPGKWRKSITQELLDILQVKSKDDIEKSRERIIQALIVLPNFAIDCLATSEEVVKSTSLLINLLVHDQTNQYTNSQDLFLIHQAMTTIFILSGKKSNLDLDLSNLFDILFPLIKTSVLALQTFEIYVNIMKVEVYDQNKEELKSQLIENLSSPFQQVRSLSASTLLFLEQGNENNEAYKMLSIIVTAENIGATIHEYRDKLRNLQLLECSDNPDRLANFNIPLYYLLGNLYINFKLLWEPVSKLITSYAKMIPAAQFWPVFVDQLNCAVTQIEKGVSTEDKHDYQCEVLMKASKMLVSVEDRPDFFNRRILLWQLMTNFPEVCEEKNRDIVLIFFNFLKNEYYRINPEEATSWNIKQGKRKTEPDGKEEDSKVNNEESMEIECVNLNESQDSDMESDDENEISNGKIVPGRTASKYVIKYL